MTNYICDIEVQNIETEQEEYWIMRFKIGALRFSLKLNKSQVLYLFSAFFKGRNNSSFLIDDFVTLRMSTERNSHFVNIDLETLNVRKQGE